MNKKGPLATQVPHVGVEKGYFVPNLGLDVLSLLDEISPSGREDTRNRQGQGVHRGKCESVREAIGEPPSVIVKKISRKAQDGSDCHKPQEILNPPGREHDSDWVSPVAFEKKPLYEFEHHDDNEADDKRK